MEHGEGSGVPRDLPLGAPWFFLARCCPTPVTSNYKMVCNAFKFEWTILKKTASKPMFSLSKSQFFSLVCCIFCKHSRTDSNFFYWTSFNSDVFSSPTQSRLLDFEVLSLTECDKFKDGIFELVALRSSSQSFAPRICRFPVWRCSRPRYHVLPALFWIKSLRLLRTTRKTSQMSQTGEMSLVGFQWFQTLGPLEVNQTHGPNIGDSLLVEQADFDDNYHILATTCHTLQRYHYLGLIFSIDDTGVNRNHLEFPELRSLAIFCNDDMVPLLRPLAHTAISSWIEVYIIILW